MKVAVVGTRGIPGVHGGVERHCEELYPRVAACGHDVTVYARAGYVECSGDYRGVRVSVLPARKGRGVEALTHTAAAMRQAARDGCDVLHVHSVGPSTLIPYARMLGLRRVVTTLHAPDYLQAKWGTVARTYLRLGERIAVRDSSAVICVSEWYASELSARYGRPVTAIPNGPGLVGVRPRADSPLLRELGLEDRRFLLFVGRLVPDKRVEDLVVARGLVKGDPTLVVAGDASDSDDYAAFLRAMSGDRVLFPGYVYGQDLADLYGACGAFVLPSAVEGLPISALEAMSFAAPVVMSDIPGNREVSDAGRCAVLYPCGDTVALEAAVRLAMDERGELGAAGLERVRSHYDWDRIAERTVTVYEGL